MARKNLMKHKSVRWHLVQQEGGWICHYCHCPLVPYDAPEGCELYYQEKVCRGRIIGYEHRPEFCEATIDHKVPISRGGSEVSLDNIVLCCWACNEQKDDRPYAWFYALKARDRARRDLWCERAKSHDIELVK